jgi:hypothetical protein
MVCRGSAARNTGAGPLGYYAIVQTPAYVVLFLEAIHEARIITLDGRPHLPASVRQWQGDSRGRWDGQTLVIDTTNFSASNNFMGSSDHLHLVERLTRVAPDRIDYAITIDGPDDLDEAVDRGHPPEAKRRAVVRVRVPRGQLRGHSRHARSRTSDRGRPVGLLSGLGARG